MARAKGAYYRKRRKGDQVVRLELVDGPLRSPVIPRNDVAWAQPELRLPCWYDMVTYRLIAVDSDGVHRYGLAEHA